MANGNDQKNKKFSTKDLEKASSYSQVLKTGVGSGITAGISRAAFTLKGLDAAGFKGWRTNKAIPPAERVDAYSLAGTYGTLDRATNPVSGQTSLAGDYTKPAMGVGENNALGTLTDARDSFAGIAQSYFTHLTGSKEQRADTQNWSWGFGDTNVSMMSPISGKNVLTGVTNVARRMGHTGGLNKAKDAAIFNQLKGRIKRRARIAKFGRPESVSPVFKEGASKDFNPYPNYDFSQKIHTPKPYVPHVYSTDQTSSKGKQRKGFGGFLNPLNILQYAGTFITGNKYKRRDMEERGYMSLIGGQVNPLQTYRQ